MTKERQGVSDPVLSLIDVVIADLSVGVQRFVARRAVDGDADTFVLQQGAGGRLRLARPDLSRPASVVLMVQAAQSYLNAELGQGVPKCPLHGHSLNFVARGGAYEWVCPGSQWRCAVGEYAERAWPEFPPEVLAPILAGRLQRRGIPGVRFFGISVGERGPVASFAVADLTPELVSALSDAAAPMEAEVHEPPRRPRRKIGPVAETHSASAVRLVLSETAVPRGGNLGYSVVNDANVSIETGLSFALDHQDDGWWYSIDTELAFRAVGLVVEPGRQRGMSAKIPAWALPGTYRLRKRVRLAFAPPSLPPGTSRPGPDDLPAELTAEFRITDRFHPERRH